MTPAVDSLLDLKGKVALVTGASAGIGRGIVLRLSEAGASVAAHYRRGREDAESVVASLRNMKRESLAVRAELTDPVSVEKAIEAVSDDLGPIDILVNNAARQTHAGFEDMDLEEWRAMMTVNLEGVFIVTKAVVTGMIARESGGAIVNIASIEGMQPAPTHGHYAVSKPASSCSPARPRCNTDAMESASTPCRPESSGAMASRRPGRKASRAG
jgi:NAD(P)-dependent dehydrogenase (short-subunit alcohol dehydrogenase family)